MEGVLNGGSSLSKVSEEGPGRVCSLHLNKNAVAGCCSHLLPSQSHSKSELLSGRKN